MMDQHMTSPTASPRATAPATGNDAASCASRTRPRRAAVALWLRLVRIEQRGHHHLTEQLRRHDLSIAQFDVIAHIGAAEGMTQQELADSLFVTKGNVCQLLDRLAQRGLLERRQEGRANRLFLTPAGRAVFDAVVPAHEAEIERMLSRLDPQERVTLHALLRKLDHAMATMPRDGADC